MRVACLQLAFTDDDSEATRITKVREHIAAVKDVDLVVLPELWHVGYFAFDRYADAAQPLDGPVVAALREGAAAAGIFVHGGSIVERADDGRLYNTSILIAPAG